MNILSLFDGISCGHLALERAGIKVDKYFASEIDRYAIQVAKKNFPDTIHIGSVIDVSYSENHLRVETPNEDDCPSGWEVPIDIHMIIGGSPCQDLSIAKKGGQGLQGEKSSLFFEYVRLLREVKPKYFLLENVASMKKADKEEITRILGVEPVMINSALVSAQNRKRLYWFGQNRKREYDDDILCKHCFYEKGRVQTKASGERSQEVLGETQGGQTGLQGMLIRVSEDGEKMNSSHLQGGLCYNKQESEGQSISTEKQAVGTGASKRVQENREMEKMERRIQENGQVQGNNEKGGCKAGEKNNESNEDSCTSSDNLTEEATSNGTGYGDTENEEVVCCMRCGKKLIYRPYNTTITKWNEGTRQFTDSLQELQFTETRQDDGGIFDTYTIGVEQPEDKGIVLKDILEENVDDRFMLNEEQVKKMQYIKGPKTFFSGKKEGSIEFPMSVERKSLTVLTSESGLNRSTNCVRVGQFNSGGQGDRVYSPEGKSVSLSANGGGRGAKTGLYSIYNQAFHEDKSMSLGTNSQCPTAKTGQIVIQPPIRKLTPIEAERLQTLPDNYTEGVSNTQRYKAIGNGWTVDVIAHIFSYIK